jgi:hypothetical protein
MSSTPTREEVKAAIRRRVSSGEPFTFHELWAPFGARPIDGGDPYRMADGLVQMWRRKGRLQRDGTIWSLTEKGRKFVAQPPLAQEVQRMKSAVASAVSHLAAAPGSEDESVRRAIDILAPYCGPKAEPDDTEVLADA